MSLDSLVERYNALLRRREDTTIQQMNRALEVAFIELMGRVRRKLGRGAFSSALVQGQLLAELRTLLPAIVPAKQDKYERMYRSLLTYSSEMGVELAQETAQEARLQTKLASVPLESVYMAARDARKYLAKHGEAFASAASFILQNGLAQGKSIPEMTSDLRKALAIPKARAATIARTESLKASNAAADEFYRQNGIDTVIYYATVDDRTCAFCAPRAGRLYRRADIIVPIHPNCRCYLAPYNPDMSDQLDSLRAKHRRQTQSAFSATGQAAETGPAPFEQQVPIPIDPN
jgi:SPP1 gp7 family putative phage head morphogenesis protein